MNDDLPVIVRPKKSSNQRASGELWLRLSAFLSMRSPNTQSTYIGIIKEWCEFLGGGYGAQSGAERIAAATDLHAIAYKNWLEKRPGEKPRAHRRESATRELQSWSVRAQKKTGLESTQSNATIAKKFAALRRIYRMLSAAGLCSAQNPFDTDRVPAPPKDSGRKRPTEMVPFELVQSILKVPDRTTPKGRRDHAILAALFGGGLRRSEACALRIGDVRITGSGTTFLYLRSTKAKKDAQQALPAWAAAAVRTLLEARKKEGAADGDFLFISYTGKGGRVSTPEPVSASGIYKLFKYYCDKAGAGRFVTPHSARATAITRLLDEGISHRDVQQFSRHSSIQMVELYDKRRTNVDNNPAKFLEYGPPAKQEED